MLKTELLENDDVTTIVCALKFLRRNVDGKHFDAFSERNTIFNFLQHGVEGALFIFILIFLLHVSHFTCDVFLQCSIGFPDSLAKECCLNTLLLPSLRKLNQSTGSTL